MFLTDNWIPPESEESVETIAIKTFLLLVVRLFVLQAPVTMHEGTVKQLGATNCS
jgi:heme/copper-type cytochrome/quinol oxidase subunit 3